MVQKTKSFFATVTIAALAACGSASDSVAPAAPIAASPSSPGGTVLPGVETVDVAISTLMVTWGIPGGALGIMKDGKLVYARGFGYSDVEAKKAATPTDLWRIASVTKPITKAAILLLVDQGRLSLDAPAFALIPDLKPLPGASVDPRLASITVRNLVDHKGGWDSQLTFDPMMMPIQIAAATGTPAPAGVEAIIRYMLGKPLSYDPGTHYAYSNFGYAVLGRIIERVSGKSYEQFVKEAVLAPAGVTRMQLGRSLYADRLPGEVRYYDLSVVPSVFPGGGSVPYPYGGFNLEAMDSHGGWVASVIDLLRFEKMWVPPPVGDYWAHLGALQGTTSILAITGSGLGWVAVFNGREMKPNSQFEAQFGNVLRTAILGVKVWPTDDLFSSYP